MSQELILQMLRLKCFLKKNDIVGRCIQTVKELIKEGRKSILIFLPFIAEALAVESKLESCAAIYSGMDTKLRDSSIKQFKNLEIKVISQVNILSYGFDHPELDAIVFARPTNSITIWYQGLGRGVRTHKNKKDCKVVDISGNFHKFGRIEDINFQEHKAYGGWAAFSGENLLTNYPLGMENVPTKASLLEYHERQEAYKNNKEIQNDPQFYFGKFKDKRLSEVIRDADGKSYLAWIIEPSTKFNFFGQKGEELKLAIYEALKLSPPTTPKVEIIKPPIPERIQSNFKTHKEVIEHYTKTIPRLSDLKGIF